MKIDKNRFLLLTTSIAASAAAAIVVSTSACNTKTTDTDAGDNNPSRSDSGKDDDGGGSADGGNTSDAGEAGACLGTDGTAPFCGPEVEGVDSGAPAKCQYECTGVSKIFKAGVAAINACLDMVPDPTVEGACEEALAPCVEGVLGKTCDDDTAATFCTTTLQTCDDAGAVPTQADCESVVKAMSAEGRAALTTCVAEGGCAGCLDSVRTGNLYVP